MKLLKLVGVLAVVPLALWGKKIRDNGLPAAARPEIAAAVERAAEHPHPRLFATAEEFAALKARAATDAYVKMGMEHVVRVSNQLLKAPVLKRIKEGRRLLGVSRNALYRIGTLSLAYRLQGDRRHLDRAVAELRAVCAFEDWNPSHFLDVAEMSLAVALGLDWLTPDLDAATRAEIAAALRRLGLEQSAKSAWWIRAHNNWGQVCHAGILSAALALAEENPAEAARYVQRCVDFLPLSMKALAPNGNYPEGPGYWSYGTEFNVVAMALLEGTLGSDFGIGSQPGFKETANYRDFVTGPSGLTFNYADGSSGRDSSCATWWFAKRYGRPGLLAYREAACYREYAARKKFSLRKGGDRMFTFAVLWAFEPPADGMPDLPLVWDAGGPVPIAVQRSSWNDDEALFVGLKGGSPSGPHAHMDGGSFVLDAKRIRWAVDLGAENYTKIEERGMSLWSQVQESDRWKIFRLGTSGHNVPMIDGSQQLVKGFAKVVRVEKAPSGAGSEVELDLSSLYTNATRVVRTGTLAGDGKSYTLRDHVEGVRPAAEIRWCMNTQADAEIAGDAVTLRQEGQTLTLVQCGARKGTWTVADAKGPNEWDSANTGLRQLTFTATATEAGTADLAVRFAK